ncbi:MAG TPA: TetR family transcriptional regulator [Gammaproteobacteria bacterium]|nr:TetR family transcriptional regulator [Gammaproteobacteria bacterium]
MARRAPQERQRDPERSKARILSAAAAEFSAHGYAGARVGAIAARAGVNKQLISYYFGGKQGLYRAIAERWLEGQNAAAPAQAEMSLAELAASFIARGREEQELARLLVWEGLTQDAQDPGAAARSARMQTGTEDLLRRQAAGELPEELDVRYFQLIFMAAAIAPVALPHVVRSIFGPKTDSGSAEFTESYAKQLRLVIERLSGSAARAGKAARPRSRSLTARSTQDA